MSILLISPRKRMTKMLRNGVWFRPRVATETTATTKKPTQSTKGDAAISGQILVDQLSEALYWIGRWHT